MTAPDDMPQPAPDVLIHQSVVDYSGYDTGTATAEMLDLTARTPEEELALSAFHTVLQLKDEAGTLTDRVIDLGSTRDVSGIADKRLPTLLMARELSKAAASTGSKVAWHVLSDVHDHVGNDLDPAALIKVPGGEADSTFVRLEEALVLEAERVSQKIILNSQAIGTYALSSVTDGQALHGYRFNRTGTQEQLPTVDLPELPSCDMFIAAAALEQVRLAPAVVRVVPFWMKDREMSARKLLRIAGHDNLPIISVIVGESGDIEKTVKWYQSEPDELKRLLPALHEAKAHRVSTGTTKKIHDGLSVEHNQLYHEFCKPDLDSNIKPFAIQDYEYLTERGREFLSRTLPAAIVYDQPRISSVTAKDVLLDIKTLMLVFGQHYDMSHDVTEHQPASVISMSGNRTNDVSYVHTFLATHPENDPAALSYSDQINLVGHFVFESLPAELAKLIRASGIDFALLEQLFAIAPPRSVILEARRSGPGLARSEPHGV